MSRYQVFWTNAANKDLEGIIEYIQQDSHSNAKKIYFKIKKQCDKLNTMPERFPALPELKEIGISHYREVSVKPYRIIYKISDQKIYILAVIDGRRNFQSIVFERLVRLND